MKKSLLLAAVLVMLSVTSYAQQSTTYKQTLAKMIEVSGTMNSFNAAVTQMVSMYKSQKTAIPEAFWTEMESAMLKSGKDDLLEMFTPIYQKHLTEADLKGIIAFYQTPAGKKLAEKTPLITQESMQAGQAWGMKLGKQIVEKLKEKGY